MSNYQPVGNYITSLSGYATYSGLSNGITTKYINLGAGAALQIYDTQGINLQAGTITSLSGIIQHSDELDFIIYHVSFI